MPKPGDSILPELKKGRCQVYVSVGYREFHKGGKRLSSFSFTSTFQGMQLEYVVKTMNFESIRRIFTNLHDRERVVHSRETPYDQSISDEELMALVKHIHEERVEGLKELIQISAKLGLKPDIDSCHKLGMVFLHNGMSREAVAELQLALEIDADSAPLLNHLGLAYLQSALFPEAENAFQRAVLLKPEYPDLHNNLGLALLKSSKFASARQEFEQALKLHQNYAEAYFNFGLCLLSGAVAESGMAAESREQMQQHLLRAIELNPAFNNEYYKVAQSYLAKDQLQEARQALIEAKTSVASQTGSEIYHEFYLRLKYGEEGVDRRATERYIAKLEGMLEKNPNFVDIRNDLGVAYLIQCRFLFNRAIGEFKKALTINPNYAKAQKNLKLAENEGKGFLILLRAILYF